jgi:hypothetical protein
MGKQGSGPWLQEHSNLFGEVFGMESTTYADSAARRQSLRIKINNRKPVGRSDPA